MTTVPRPRGMHACVCCCLIIRDHLRRKFWTPTLSVAITPLRDGHGDIVRAMTPYPPCIIPILRLKRGRLPTSERAAIESTCCGRQVRGAKEHASLVLFPLVRHTRHDSIVRLCMFGLFRHVGKNQRGEQKKVCVITASRAGDLHSGTIKPPNYSPSPDCNPSKRSSRSYLSAAFTSPHAMCVSQSGRALAAGGGGELARPITKATASAGGSGEPQSLEPPPLLSSAPVTGGPKRRLGSARLAY